MARFFVPSLPPSAACVLSGEPAHRIIRVLRLGSGDEVRLFDGSGREVVARIATVDRATVTVTIEADIEPEPGGAEIHLYAALIRPQRFEWLVEKATELGVASIRPVISGRCQVRAAELGRARTERLARIAIEAAEQCGRRTLPRLAEPAQLDEALEHAPGMMVLPWEEARGAGPLLGSALRRACAPADESGGSCVVSLLVGPEGGFTAGEVEMARGRGAVVVSLGPLVLRSETAAIAAVAIARDALG